LADSLPSLFLLSLVPSPPTSALLPYTTLFRSTFPMLLLRNSALLISEKQQKKLKKIDLEIADLFLKQDDLIEKVTRKHSEINIDFYQQKEFLKKQFEDLYELAKKTDKSFLGAVSAQERKQIKGIENLEKRLLK